MKPARVVSAAGLFLVGAAMLLYQWALLRKGLEFIVSSMTIDDTYYYLQTAWNTKLFGFPTFDGTNPTNGVQLLWFLLLVPFAWLFQDKATYLLGTLQLAGMLNVACFCFIYLLGKRTGRLWLPWILAALWSLQLVVLETFNRPYLSGMEASVHAFLFWGVVWQTTGTFQRIGAGKSANWIGLCTLLVLSTWARLDTAVFSLVIFAACSSYLALKIVQGQAGSWRIHRRPLIGGLVVSAVGAAILFGAFRWMDDSFLPVTALIKATQRAQESGRIQIFADALALSFPHALKIVSQALLLPPVVFGLAVVALNVTATFVRPRSTALALFRTWCVLGVGVLCYCGIIALFRIEYNEYFTWYRSPVYIFWIVGTACSVEAGRLIASRSFVLWSRLAAPPEKVGRRSHRVAAVVSIAISVAIGAAAYRTAFGFLSSPPVPNLFLQRLGVARFMEREFPRETTFAAWNAGELGYFSNRKVVNLDGLINSVSFSRLPASDRLDYLHRQNIDYIVDYRFKWSDPAPKTFIPVHTFRGAPPFTVWRVPPRQGVKGSSLGMTRETR